jgi:hypothetical protein
VGLYSEELFNKHIGPPNLALSSASASSFTISKGGSGLGSYYNNPQGVIIYLVNNGGSGTYGPISISFTVGGASPDPNMVLMPSNTTTFSSAYTAGPVMAFCADGPGQEVPNNSSATLAGESGYSSGNQVYLVNPSISLQFWYNTLGAPGGAGSVYSPEIDMLISDPLGNQWHSYIIFTITI